MFGACSRTLAVILVFRFLIGMFKSLSHVENQTLHISIQEGLIILDRWDKSADKTCKLL